MAENETSYRVGIKRQLRRWGITGWENEDATNSLLRIWWAGYEAQLPTRCDECARGDCAWHDEFRAMAREHVSLEDLP